MDIPVPEPSQAQRDKGTEMARRLLERRRAESVTTSGKDHAMEGKTKKTATTLEVCVDCLFLLANGEVTDENGNDITEAHAAKVSAIWGDTEITLGRIAPEGENDDEDHSWFSWQSCDCCGSTLGGDREYATAWSKS